MKAREMVELAAWVSRQSHRLIERRGRLAEAPVYRFWKCSRRRVNEWMLGFSRYAAEAPNCAAVQRRRLWEGTRPLLADFFTCDVLARVWSATLTALDERGPRPGWEPIGRHVLLGHLQARYLALDLMVNEPTVPPRDLARLDRLRRRNERWTDLLLGPLVHGYAAAADFAFDAPRSEEFGREQQHHDASPAGSAVWALTLSGLRKAFPDEPDCSDRAGDRHRRALATAVVAAFPGDLFRPPLVPSEIARVGADSSPAQQGRPTRTKPGR